MEKKLTKNDIQIGQFFLVKLEKENLWEV